jgi:mannose-6-phosphate isomerase-like protein (cupin superfamily)
LLKYVRNESRRPLRSGKISLYIPAESGIATWFNGDILTTKLTAAQTDGALGFVEATVPPGGGPVPHIHHNTDETFYLISGELEFLQGDRIISAGGGDLVFCQRGITHRFRNIGIQPAKMILVFTPGGPEGLFIEAGDEPQPGVQVQPWGMERLDDHLMSLLVKYDNALPPGDPG